MGQNDLYRDKIEVSLDGRQIFSLFFAGAIIICTVFVIGVMVGKRVEARAHVDRSGATQGDPLAALDRLESESPLTFRRALRHGEVAAGSVDSEIAALAAAQRAAEVAGKGAEPSESAGKAAKGEGKAESKPEGKAEAKAESKAESKPEGKAEAKAESKAESKPEAKSDARTEGKADSDAAKPAKGDAEDAERGKDAKAEGKSKKSKYTLQLSSFQERAEADAFLVELRAAGYAPFVVSAEVEGKGTFYRVRLGSYPSYEAAVEAKIEFERKISRIAYVTKI